MSDTTILLLSTLAILVLIGVLMALAPLMSGATVPLGVRVPSSRVSSPTVRRAVRSYQTWCLALTAVACAIALAWRTVGAMLVLMLALLGGCMVVWVLTRRAIVAAKRSGSWYEGVPVRLSAPLDRDSAHVRPLWWLHVLALATGIAALVVTLVRYPSLPDPYPSHWNGAGVVDGWTPKGWGAVLTAPLMALGMGLLLLAVSAVVAHGRRAVHPDGNRTLATSRQWHVDTLVQQGGGGGGGGGSSGWSPPSPARRRPRWRWRPSWHGRPTPLRGSCGPASLWPWRSPCGPSCGPSGSAATSTPWNGPAQQRPRGTGTPSSLGE